MHVSVCDSILSEEGEEFECLMETERSSNIIQLIWQKFSDYIWTFWHKTKFLVSGCRKKFVEIHVNFSISLDIHSSKYLTVKSLGWTVRWEGIISLVMFCHTRPCLGLIVQSRYWPDREAICKKQVYDMLLKVSNYWNN